MEDGVNGWTIVRSVSPVEAVSKAKYETVIIHHRPLGVNPVKEDVYRLSSALRIAVQVKVC